MQHMMLLVHGRAPRFDNAKFRAFLKNHCGLSFTMTRIAVGKIRAGERVALNIEGLPDSNILDELGVLYKFQP
ncbi:hypothetical protein [Pseudomonas nitroreducens]|uniref:hypothetical protein n=1 Tax=Pseudomonas nitroreducens TaxID=46680 RepID=UPI00209CDB14|nr:hypothetical protein [Pseudomonas nitroreducens]MCP1625337.1 hypothetical protein [Pseudomonas nitroreducens]